MDDLRFDRLSKQIAEGNTRRGLLRVVTGISLVGAGALLVHDDGSAKARRGRGVQSEHRRKKKAFYCLDGETIRRVRRKQNALLALEIAHRGYVIETGSIVLEDTGKNLLASEQVRKAYLGED